MDIPNIILSLSGGIVARQQNSNGSVGEKDTN